MGAGAVGRDLAVVGDDAGPDGGEGQEDADEGEGDGGEFGDAFVELEAGEDGCCDVVRKIGHSFNGGKKGGKWNAIPGITIV